MDMRMTDANSVRCRDDEPLPSTRALRALAATVARVCVCLSRPAMNRRVMHRLSALSDRELKDIGLLRQDVRDAALPENGDAMEFLLARRGDARRWRRGPFRR